MNAHRVTDDELHAYVDGQLDGDRRLIVERWLADDPDAARRAEDYRAQMALLHEIFDPVLREPASDPVHDLTEKLRGRVAGNDNVPSWHARPWVRMAAAIMLVVAGAGGGWMGRGAVNSSPAVQQRQALQTFAEEATQAHRFYTSDERFQVELGADNQDELNSWLSKRVGRDVFGPDLGKVGFRLIGGRSLPTDLGAGAQYMYVNDANKRVTLFVGAPQAGNPAKFGFAQNGDVATIYWVEGSLAYALAGRLSKEELLGIAEAVYNDVKAGNPARRDPPPQNQQPPQDQQQQQDQQPNGVQPISDTQKPKDS
ncbi:anti-sigma factor family protein [Azospirillum sp. sgz302134]